MGKKRHESISSSSDENKSDGSSSSSDSESTEKSRKKQKKAKVQETQEETRKKKKHDRHHRHHSTHKKEKYDHEESRDQSKTRHDADGERSRGYYEHERDRSRSHHSSHRNQEKERKRYDESRPEKNDNRETDNRENRHSRYDRNEQKDRRNERHQPRRERRNSGSFDHTHAEWGKASDQKETKKTAQEKEKPNFKLSGKLTEETNTYRGVVIKYSEPPEARKPRRRWRLYPFKGEQALQTLYIHRESAYLIGRERKVVDIPVDHPSCSKQHAALQYRLVPFTRDDGSVGKRVRPYIIDLESANGTFINNKKIEPKKYVELLEKDVIKFGFSSREYVLLHENSKDETMDDDVFPEDQDLIEIKKEEKD